MRKTASLALSLFLLTGTAFADSPKDSPKDAPKDAPKETAAKSAKAAAANAATKTNAELAAQMEELRQALQAQQEQLQMLKEELAKRDRQIDEAREAAASANARAAEANTKAVEAVTTSTEVKSTATALNATVSDLKVSNEVLKDTVAGGGQAAANKATEEGPISIRYKGITITPGGFLAAETVFPHSLGTIGCEYAAVQRNSFQRQSAGPCNGIPSLRPPDAGQCPCGDQDCQCKS